MLAEAEGETGAFTDKGMSAFVVMKKFRTQIGNRHKPVCARFVEFDKQPKARDARDATWKFSADAAFQKRRNEAVVAVADGRGEMRIVAKVQTEVADIVR